MKKQTEEVHNVLTADGHHLGQSFDDLADWEEKPVAQEMPKLGREGDWKWMAENLPISSPRIL